MRRRFFKIGINIGCLGRDFIDLLASRINWGIVGLQASGWERVWSATDSQKDSSCASWGHLHSVSLSLQILTLLLFPGVICFVRLHIGLL